MMRFGFDDWAAFNCFHGYFRPRYYRDNARIIEETGYEPEVQTRLATEFLERLDPPDTFCLFLSWEPPHDSYHQVPGGYRNQYDPAALELRANVRSAEGNPLARGLECWRTIADYHAAITALDGQFARFLATLDRRWRREVRW